VSKRIPKKKQTFEASPVDEVQAVCGGKDLWIRQFLSLKWKNRNMVW